MLNLHITVFASKTITHKVGYLDVTIMGTRTSSSPLSPISLAETERNGILHRSVLPPMDARNDCNKRP